MKIWLKTKRVKKVVVMMMGISLLAPQLLLAGTIDGPAGSGGLIPPPPSNNLNAADVAGIAGMPNLGGMNAGNKAKTLEEIRKEYEKICKVEQQGFDLEQLMELAQGLGGNAANTLEGVIGKGLNQSFGQTLQNVFTEKITDMVEDILVDDLPREIERTLNDQIPRLLDHRLNELSASGMSDEDISASMPEILQQVIDSALPQIITDLIQELITKAITDNLARFFGEVYREQIPSIVDDSTIPEQVSGIVATTTTGSVGADGASITGLGGTEITTSANLNQLIPEADRETIVQRMGQGVIDAAIQGILNGPAIHRLAEQFAPFFIRRVTGALDNQMGSLVPNVLSNFGNGGGYDSATSGFDFMDWAGNDVTEAAGFGLSPISEAVSGPLADGLHQSFVTMDTNEVLTNFNMDRFDMGPQTFSPTGALGVLGPKLNDVPGLESVALFQDGDGRVSALAINGVAQDAGEGLTGAADGIGKNALSGFNWGAVGNGLLGGLSDGFSGGLEGLVDDIPIVGGLLSPIVGDVSNVLFDRILGVKEMFTDPVQISMMSAGAGAVMSAQTESALGLWVGNHSWGDIAALIWGLYSVEGNGFAKTKAAIDKTTAQVKQVNKNLDRDYKEQLEQKSFLTQACTYLKMITGEMKSLNDLFYTHIPNAADRKAGVISKATEEFYATVNKGRQILKSSTGVAGRQSEPLYGESYEKLLQEERDNAYAVAIDTIENNKKNIPNADQVLKDLETDRALNKKSPGGITRSPAWTLAREQEFLEGKSNDYAFDLTQYLDPDYSNNPVNGARLAKLYVDRQIAQAEADTREQLAANEGWTDLKICIKFTRDGTGCREYKIVTSASDLRTYKQALDRNVLDQLINNPMYQSDAMVAQLLIVNRKLGDFTNEAKIKSLLESQDPCKGTAPCPSTGWNTQGAKPDLNNYPGANLLSDFYYQADWRTKFDEAFSESATDLIEDKLDDFMGQGERELSRFTDLGNVTRLLSGDSRYRQFEADSLLPDFADNFIESNRDLFPNLTDDNRPRLIELLVEFLTQLITQAMGQNR